jgi:hypothetical protein
MITVSRAWRQSTASAVLRTVSSLSLALVCMATSCVEVRAIAVSPPHAMPLDSALAHAVALTQRFGARYGLDPYTDPYQAQEHFALCMAHESYFLCIKTSRGEVQFRDYNAGRFTARTDSLHRELADSLRTMFGAERVRACSWRSERPSKESGCRRTS